MIVASHLGHISGLHDVTCMAAGNVSPHYIYIVCIIGIGIIPAGQPS